MRPKTLVRTEARRVSDPAQKGEFAESATKSGTLRERRDGPDGVLLVRDRDVDVQPVDSLH
jgi:hypothetical protein